MCGDGEGWRGEGEEGRVVVVFLLMGFFRVCVSCSSILSFCVRLYLSVCLWLSVPVGVCLESRMRVRFRVVTFGYVHSDLESGFE